MLLTLYFISISIGLSSAFSCPSPNGIFADPEDATCRSYYICGNGTPYIYHCGAGLRFDASIMQCNWEANVPCLNNPTTTMTTTSPTSSPGSFSCPEPNGIFANPYDTTCSTYYICANGIAYQQRCSPGTVYDPNIKNCNWAANYQCNSIPPTSRPTTPTTISTTASSRPYPSTTGGNCGGGKKMVCYYPNWAYYRQGEGQFLISDIDASMCTHVVYAFAVLNTQTYEIRIFDQWLDIELKNYENFVGLKKANPGLKTLIAIGGWVDSTTYPGAYKNLFKDSQKRQTFIKSAVAFLQKYGFDGLDLDYEYPDANDKQNFGLFVKELKEAFQPHGFEVTAAISASISKINEGYDISIMAQYIDAVHLMAYDFHGSWESTADHHSPLKARPWDTQKWYAEAAVEYLLNNGLPSSKLILGIPTYGRSFSVQANSDYKPPLPANDGGQAGPITQASGVLGYQEICLNIQNNGWTLVEDPLGPYAYKGTQWVGFDTIDYVTTKANYINNNNNLGGAMFWDLATDDFNNRCGNGNFPLVNTVKQALNC